MRNTSDTKSMTDEKINVLVHIPTNVTQIRVKTFLLFWFLVENRPRLERSSYWCYTGERVRV